MRLILWTLDKFITKAKSKLEYVTNELTVDVSKNVCTDNIAFHCLFSVSMCLQSLVEDMCSVGGSSDQEDILNQVEYHITDPSHQTSKATIIELLRLVSLHFQKYSRAVPTYHPYQLHSQQIK